MISDIKNPLSQLLQNAAKAERGAVEAAEGAHGCSGGQEGCTVSHAGGCLV